MDTKLDTKIILEKEFKTGMRGYNQEEVDLFLDDVIQDYQAFKKTIMELQHENQRYKKNWSLLKNDLLLETLAQRISICLKRISNLEKHVFGSKVYDQE